MGRKLLLVVATFAAVVVAGLGASTASAGEVTGNCSPDTKSEKAAANCKEGQNANANSECSFSGREDENREGSPLRTQTPHEVWLNPAHFPVPPGGIVVNPEPGSPGTACNGNLSPRK